MNFEANKIGDSSYHRLLNKYHKHLIPMYDETMKLHESLNASILRQIWSINNHCKMLVISEPDPKTGTFSTQYVIMDSNDSVLSVLHRDTFPKEYVYKNSDYRPYTNLDVQIFDGKFAIFGRLSCTVDKRGLSQKKVYEMDGSKGKLYWAFDVFKWQR